jgi:hypothetical protein
MNMHRTVVMVASLAVSPLALGAQSPAAKFVDSARVEIDRAVLASDTARLIRAEVLLDRALVVFPGDPWLLHYRGYAAYRHALVRFSAGDLPGATPFIDLGITELTLSSDKLKWPETYSLLAALTSFEIAIDPSRGRDLGAQIGAIAGQALQAGPSNPRVLLIAAEGAEKTPPEYGGGLERARALAKQATAAFVNDHPAPLAPAWGREELADTMKRLDLPSPGKP